MFGAMGGPVYSGGELSGVELAQAEEPTKSLLPDVLIGLLMAGASGALTGGLAAWSWTGVGIGAGVNLGAWALFTLIGTWDDLDTQARTSLSVGVVLGSLGAGTLGYARAKGAIK